MPSYDSGIHETYICMSSIQETYMHLCILSYMYLAVLKIPTLRLYYLPCGTLCLPCGTLCLPCGTLYTLQCLVRPRTASRTTDQGVLGSRPGHGTFTHCLVLVKPRKPSTDDFLGLTVARLETTLFLMCLVQGT